MVEGLLLMSGQERERSHVVRQAVEHRLSQQEGAERLGIGVRQFKRLIRADRVAQRWLGSTDHSTILIAYAIRT
jgi:hypothetical protein